VSSKRRWLLLIGAIAVYVFVVPPFWPDPTVRADLPPEAFLDEEPEIKVTVSAWHSNFQIAHVRFYVDRGSTTAHGPRGPLHPLVLHNAPRMHRWSFWRLDRLTWPRSRVLRLALPLKRLSQEGVVKPGIVRGKIDVEVDYVLSTVEPLALWLGEYISTMRTYSRSFELQLHPRAS